MQQGKNNDANEPSYISTFEDFIRQEICRKECHTTLIYSSLKQLTLARQALPRASRRFGQLSLPVFREVLKYV